MPVRGTAVLDQPGHSGLPIAAQPDIAGLTRDRIPLAEFGHRPLVQLVLKDKQQLLFPSHRSLFMAYAHYLQALATG
jgi:hypothetical protein